MLTLDPPRFRNGPAMCPSQNLPAFESRAEAEQYLNRHLPGCKVTRIGKCDQCGHWHFEAEARGPSGSDNGTDTRPLTKNNPLPTLERAREIHTTMQRLAQSRGNKK